MDEVELSELIDRLDDQSQDRAESNRREDQRQRRAVCDVELEVPDASGQITWLRCCTRNICEHGVSLMLGRWLNPGLEVTLTLGRTDGGRESLTGVVVHCRPVGGSIHEAGIAFHGHVDPARYQVAT